ncbi:protein transport protein SEC16B homolog isoform X1 [Phoenix dactylifera]|uniref:Protein transport protein sec16 n=1 Tax=Phoenix dactylifera TaxID=42345 RepID=A0A8B8Z9P6_PHODC|nr:protein transport protein SEC16B homolog isoform X1 [Phoenix dactylifera]XP_038970786.1 protein transport protein SEC16B homolog isoform X1 [Phoenix dactylifera]
MASPPPFQMEDQTDEDFFDKLVDDEFIIDGSHSKATDMARDLSNLSLGDVGTSLEDSGDAGFASEVEDRHENRTLESFEASKKDDLDADGSMASNSSDDKVAQSESSAEPAKEFGSQGSSTMKSGLKGTTVKEVQWSAFGVNSQQFDNGGFEPYLGFLTESADGSANKLKSDADLNTSFIGNTVENLNAYVGSSEQQDTQFYGSSDEQITGTNDAQHWESLYPGWKYDLSTGQWYQVDGYDPSMTRQIDSYNTANEAQESFEDNGPAVVDGSISERSDVSYLQQSAQSVLETIAEDGTLSGVSNWNQVSQVTTEYPSNMVFDPQYPGWYYDTNTQQWYALETYAQTTQMASSTVQDEVSQDVHSSAGFSEQNQNLYDEVGQSGQYPVESQVSQDFGGDWNSSTSNYMQRNMWLPEPTPNSKQVGGFPGNQQLGSFYSSTGHAGSQTSQQTGFKTFEPIINHNDGRSNSMARSQSFVPAESTYQFNQPKVEQSLQSHLSNSYYGNQNSLGYSQQPFQGANASYSQFSYTPHEERSSAGRPAHALVTFGFGGKLIIMKDDNSFGTKLDYGSQGTAAGTVSVLNLIEVIMDRTDASSTINGGAFDYFHALCQQSFPGPLVGGNAATKDINKWIDERIASCESPGMDFQKGELLRLLLSLLKISCQHYGKLRSPFGSDPSLEETDGPEMAVTKLFASAKRNSVRLREHGSFVHCMQNLPSEGQIQATAVEVQNLLVSGRRKEALQCAQEGHLWGPALVLAAQLGEKFYVDTVKRMAHHQFISGSPLRTLCLLIAGQPADVFSAGSSSSSLYAAANLYQQLAETQASGMLDDWEENLAIITANRTKDDELVIIHLGDCLWKERGEVTAAHTCYLVAEANFESYSDSARLCLIGSDHWKCPRTYASPEAIQRTELYEYSKVLGNSQFILLPFQPYKLIYAYMLADMGKVPDSLRYCQASLKLLKNSGRTPEVEMWKLLFSSLEERLKTHQQGGYSTNLAPGKLVGKFITSLDRSLHRMMGAPQVPLPPMPQGSVNDNEIYSGAPKVANSQSTMVMSSLIPSASVEAMSEWTSDSGRKSMHNRSISEPDFGRSPKQNSSKDAGSDGRQSKASVPEGSRFGRIGSTLLQKTVGWVSRSHRQAKLGEQNKFYYDQKLKRWVEEGAEPPAEEAALPPPPTAASFQNGMPDYNIKNTFKSSENLAANGGSEVKSSVPTERSSGIPPIPPSQNQFSARSRMGVRSRYVDTFNKAGGALTNSFQSPSAPSLKPAAGAKFFIPTAPATTDEPKTETITESQETTIHEEPSSSVVNEASFSSPPSSSSSSSMQRFPSMDHITPGKKGSGAAFQSGNGPLSRTRAASWSGSYTDAFNPKVAQTKPAGDGQIVPPFFMPNNTSHTRSSSSSSVQLNVGSLGDDLHEVEL